MRRLIPATAVPRGARGHNRGPGRRSRNIHANDTLSCNASWVTHVARYTAASPAPCARLSAQGQNGSANASAPALSRTSGTNVQMNDDSYPPYPRTRQRSRTRRPTLRSQSPRERLRQRWRRGDADVERRPALGEHPNHARSSSEPRDFCNGGDPGVVYSRRDGAFYLSQLCFFRALPFSEVHVYKSVDNGQTGRPAARPRVAASNFDYRPARSTNRSSTTKSSSPSTTTQQPALRTRLRHLHQVPHSAGRVQRLLPDPALVHGLDPNREPRAVDLVAHCRSAGRPRR